MSNEIPHPLYIVILVWIHRQYTYAPIRWSWAPVHRTQIVVIEVVRLRPRLPIITSNPMNHDHLLHGMSTILGKFVCFHHHSHSINISHCHQPTLPSPSAQNTRKSRIEGTKKKIHSMFNAEFITISINIKLHFIHPRVELNDIAMKTVPHICVVLVALLYIFFKLSAWD